MSQQSFPSNDFASVTFADPPTSSGSVRTILISIGVVFLLLVLFCAGVIFWIVSTVRSSGNVSEQYMANREPVGGVMSKPFVEIANQAEPLEPIERNSQLIQSVYTFLNQLQTVDQDEFKQHVNFKRLVKEMEESGMSKGVNAFTNAIWTVQVVDGVEQPNFGDEFEIIDFTWLQEDREARVTVACFPSWSDNPRIKLVYLTRKADDWMFYDLRDTALPLSDAQYLALFSAAPDSNANSLSEFSDAIDEILDEEGDNKDKSKRMIAEYRRRDFYAQMEHYAQCHLGEQLLLYDLVDGLSEIAPEFNETDFALSLYLKGRLALLKQNKSEAFRCANRMVEQVGWHPAAALLAVDSAQSDEEKKLATQWLARSALIAPGHNLTVAKFFEIADSNALSEFVGKLERRSDGPSRFIEMIEAGYSVDFAPLIQAAKDSRPLALARQYGELSEIETIQGHEQEVFKLANTIFASPETSTLIPRSLGDELIDDPVENVWEKYLTAATSKDMFAIALKSASDRIEFLKRFREQSFLYGSSDFPWAELRDAIQALPTDSKLPSEDETTAFLGVAESSLERHDQALSILLPLIKKKKAALISDDDQPAYGYSIVDKAAYSAVRADRTKELIEAIGNDELAFLVIHSNLDDSPIEKRKGICDWYEGLDNPKLWLNYYLSQIAYEQGDWEAADVNISKAYEEGIADSRIENFEMPSIFYDFIPFEEHVSEWTDQRVELAIRCGRVSEFLAKIRDQPDTVEEIAYSFSTFDPLLICDLNSMQTVSDLLGESEDVDLRKWSLRMKSQVSLVRNDPNAAIDNLIEAMTLSDPDSYYDSELGMAVNVVYLYQLWDRVEDLEQVRSENSNFNVLKAAKAIRDGKADDLIALIDDDADGYETNFITNDQETIVAQQWSGVFETVNRKHPISINSLGYSSNANGIVLLSKPASELAPKLESVLSSILGPNRKSISLENFPQAACGWYVDNEAGRIIAVAYDEPATESTNKVIVDLKKDSPGLFCIAFLPSAENHSESRFLPSKMVREIALQFGRELQESRGFVDLTAQSRFVNDDKGRWNEQLQSVLVTGVDPKRPKPFYLWIYGVGIGEVDKEKRVRINLGLIVEDVPAQIESSKSTIDEDETEIVHVLEQSPTLLPFLSSGTRVK